MCFLVVGVDLDVGVWEGEFFEGDPSALGEGAEPAGVLGDVSGLGTSSSLWRLCHTWRAMQFLGQGEDLQHSATLTYQCEAGRRRSGVLLCKKGSCTGGMRMYDFVYLVGHLSGCDCWRRTRLPLGS